ncbi:receptor-interacting serine/threonine-protein kinase 3-like isoform X2 [Epinephelus lanceolatus]
MAVSSHKPVGNDNLEKWESVASGGFGHVYKARHKDWGFDVAIKILRHGICPFMSLSEEAAHMDKASCEFVLRRYGIYQGCPPGAGPSMQNGIVMEFMRGGSVESLLKVLSGPPPWPLVFRLAHQVALGMNFLHHYGLMHHDLKPSNVLLTIDLNAKLADFGLCRVSTSALNNNEGSREKSLREIGGTYKYMPPEAFKEPYEPHRSYDVYSYGILLWSIVTGKEPYGTGYDHVKEAICDGQRPSLVETDQNKAEGLKELVVLIKKCWDGDPSSRPLFIKCREDTENLFSKHEEGIHEAVQQVSARLKSPTSNQQSNTRVAIDVPPQTQGQTKPNDTVDFVRFTRTERPSAQDSVRVFTESMSIQDKAKFVDANRAKIIRSVAEVMSITEDLGDMVHGEAYSWIRAQVTSHEKMRVLYDRSLRSGGEVVKAAFYDALKSHHPELVKGLGGSS